MSIPLDRLYHFINNIASEIHGDRVIIYRFWPHGSKNITDLNNLLDADSDWYSKIIFPAIWCNDQEPLDYEFYSEPVKIFDSPWSSILKSVNLHYTPKNLSFYRNIFEKNLLLHSEKRSSNLKKYSII
jgi:hypothetical protein